MAGDVYRPRVVVSKLGPGRHDRGARIVARLLRSTGVEVIYTAPTDASGRIVETALEEDADAIVLLILARRDLELVWWVLGLLRVEAATDVAVAVGGTISAVDAARLERLGVFVFTAARTVEDIGISLRCSAKAAVSGRHSRRPLPAAGP